MRKTRLEHSGKLLDMYLAELGRLDDMAHCHEVKRIFSTLSVWGQLMRLMYESHDELGPLSGLDIPMFVIRACHNTLTSIQIQLGFQGDDPSMIMRWIELLGPEPGPGRLHKKKESKESKEVKEIKEMKEIKEDGSLPVNTLPSSASVRSFIWTWFSQIEKHARIYEKAALLSRTSVGLLSTINGATLLPFYPRTTKAGIQRHRRYKVGFVDEHSQCEISSTYHYPSESCFSD
jgi:hypothetical protein